MERCGGANMNKESNEKRNECKNCYFFNVSKQLCFRWDINRGVGDGEPIKGKFNPVEHNCFKQ